MIKSAARSSLGLPAVQAAIDEVSERCLHRCPESRDTRSCFFNL